MNSPVLARVRTEALAIKAPNSALAAPARPLSIFEFWPPFIFYAPVVLQWVVLAIRHRGTTLPALANPGIDGGGLCGESKTETFSLLGREGRARLAPFTSLVTRNTNDTDGDFRRALAAMRSTGLTFPIVVKPDIGCRETGVFAIENRQKLAAYLHTFPRGARLILQCYVPDPGEAGVFYVRRPGEARGRITSLTLKYFPTVTGDGVSTVAELIRADKRAGRVTALYFKQLAPHLHLVPCLGEPFPLAFAGNHCKGAIFRNGNHLITAAMEARFDAIAREIPGYYFGRFDVRFADLDDFRRGDDFTIIEFNGAGSEATHIWDPETTLREAYRSLWQHFSMAFEIGAIHRARGVKPLRLIDLWRRYRAQQKLIRGYPDRLSE